MGLMQTFGGTTDTLTDVRFDVDIELTSNLTLVLVFELIESALETKGLIFSSNDKICSHLTRDPSQADRFFIKRLLWSSLVKLSSFF